MFKTLLFLNAKLNSVEPSKLPIASHQITSQAALLKERSPKAGSRIKTPHLVREWDEMALCIVVARIRSSGLNEKRKKYTMNP